MQDARPRERAVRGERRGSAGEHERRRIRRHDGVCEALLYGYKAGLDPYLSVLSARTALLSQRQTALSFRIQRVVAAVRLVEALGGGWSGSLPKPPELAGKPKTSP